MGRRPTKPPVGALVGASTKFAAGNLGLPVREEKARQTDEERLAEAERAKAAAEIEKLRAELSHLLDNLNVLADRMKSLTDVVTFRDATSRLRAEIHDVFGHLPQVNSGAIELVPPSGTLGLHSTAPSVVEMAARSSSFASGRASADRAGPQRASPGTQVAAIVKRTLSERPGVIAHVPIGVVRRRAVEGPLGG